MVRPRSKASEGHVPCYSPGREPSQPSQANLRVLLFTNSRENILSSLIFYPLIFPAILTQKSSVVSAFLGKNIIYSCSSPVPVNILCDMVFVCVCLIFVAVTENNFHFGETGRMQMSYNLFRPCHPLHAEIALKIFFLINTSHSLSFKISYDVKRDR